MGACRNFYNNILTSFIQGLTFLVIEFWVLVGCSAEAIRLLAFSLWRDAAPI